MTSRQTHCATTLSEVPEISKRSVPQHDRRRLNRGVGVPSWNAAQGDSVPRSIFHTLRIERNLEISEGRQQVPKAYAKSRDPLRINDFRVYTATGCVLGQRDLMWVAGQLGRVGRVRIRHSAVANLGYRVVAPANWSSDRRA